MSALFDDLRRPAGGLACSPLSDLWQAPRRLPTGWLFDARGTALYQRLTRRPGHAAAEAEALLLASAARPIAEAVGPGSRVVVAGAGLLRGLPGLLAALERPARCTLLDLPEVLAGAPLQGRPGGGRTLVVLPGSVLALMSIEAATSWLERAAREAGPGALLVTCADATRDPALVLPSFNDAEGVAVELNRHALVRLAREAGARLDPDAFRPVLRWDASHQRAELHLASEYTQAVVLPAGHLRLAMGETLLTAAFQGWSVLRLQALAQRAGWAPLQMWMDGPARHAMHVLERRP